MKRLAAIGVGLALLLTVGCGADDTTGAAPGIDVLAPPSDTPNTEGDGAGSASDATGGSDAGSASDATGGSDAGGATDGGPDGPGPGTDTSSDACAPSCEGKACGPDGCGGSCGDCADADDPCTDAVCDQGACSVTFTEASCDDEDACTTDDACVEGVCSGAPMDCEDDNTCTDNWCNQGYCMNEPSEDEACALTITIDTPVRAAILEDLDVVVVSGTVASPAALIDHITLNGQDLGVTNEGAFTTTLAPTIGLNILVASGSNALEQEHQVAQSYLYGESFLPVGSLENPTMLDDAMGLWLSPEAFDDNNRTDIDDLATLAYLVLDNLDLNAMLPDPLFPEDERPGYLGCDYDVTVSDVDITVDEVEAAPIDGGLHIYIEIEDLYAYVSAVSDDGWPIDTCADALGPITASMVSVDVTLTVEVVDGKPVVSIADGDLNVVMHDFDWTIEGGLAASFNWLIGMVMGTIESKIVEALETQVANQIVPVVNELLVDFTAFDRIFAVPAFRTGGQDAVLNFSVALGDAVFAETGVHLSLTVGSSADDELEVTVPGTLAGANCVGDLLTPLDKLPKISVAEAYLDADLSNQVLHSFWASGYMHTTITEDTLGDMAEPYGLSDPKVTIAPTLPPVLTTCTDLGDAELQLGDVHVVAEFGSALGPLVLDLYASGTVGADLTTYPVADGPDALGIEAINPGTVVLDLQSIEGDVTLFSDEMIELLLGSILSDVLAGDLFMGLVGSFPLPSVPIGEYIPGLPADATLAFDPKTLQGDGAHMVLGGDLETN